VVVPEGLQEVAVTLEPQRAVGGALNPGDRVGVFVTEGATTADGQAAGARPPIDGVLVTRVQGGVVDAGTDSDGAIAATSASTTLTVTVAVTADQAASLVGGMELGRVWLSLQTPAAGADTSLTSTTGTTTN
jgi:pilus assembly protein CpaB